MARDHGHEVKVALETDVVSGRGMSLRLGVGKVRLVNTQWSWVYVFPQEQGFGKYQDSYHRTNGRSQVSLNAALDGWSRVDSDRHRTPEQT